MHAIVRSVPLQPPVADITNNLAMRSQQVGQKVNQTSNQFVKAVAEGLSQPSKIALAGISDLNSNLEALLNDLQSQQSRADELGRVLAQGPLSVIPQQINQTMGNVVGGFQVGSEPNEPLGIVVSRTVQSPAGLVLGTG